MSTLYCIIVNIIVLSCGFYIHVCILPVTRSFVHFPSLSYHNVMDTDVLLYSHIPGTEWKLLLISGASSVGVLPSCGQVYCVEKIIIIPLMTDPSPEIYGLEVCCMLDDGVWCVKITICVEFGVFCCDSSRLCSIRLHVYVLCTPLCAGYTLYQCIPLST